MCSFFQFISKNMCHWSDLKDCCSGFLWWIFVPPPNRNTDFLYMWDEEPDEEFEQHKTKKPKKRKLIPQTPSPPASPQSSTSEIIIDVLSQISSQIQEGDQEEKKKDTVALASMPFQELKIHFDSEPESQQPKPNLDPIVYNVKQVTDNMKQILLDWEDVGIQHELP